MRSISRSTSSRHARPRTAKRSPRLIAGATVSALALAAVLAAVALGAGVATTVNSASNSTLRQTIVVNARGLTLYALTPETTHHLLCKSRECLERWPPLTVRSRTTKLRAGPGVHGSLAILRRSNGKLQVTLRGRPLYRFAEDHAKGQANGQGLESFGGTWHAVTASAGSGRAPSHAPAAPKAEYPGYTY